MKDPSPATMSGRATIELPVDPAFSVTARVFVASVARLHGADDATVDDLKLAISELLANAVESSESASVSVTVTVEEGVLTLKATGIGEIADGEPVSRRRLLEGLFDDATLDGDALEIRIPIN